jgi:hypothetical protein
MAEWDRRQRSGHGSLENTIEVNAGPKRRQPTTDLFEVLVSQLLDVLVGVGRLFWGRHELMDRPVFSWALSTWMHKRLLCALDESRLYGRKGSVEAWGMSLNQVKCLLGAAYRRQQEYDQRDY